MKDLKTILIGIFVLSYMFFSYDRRDIGRYQFVAGQAEEKKDIPYSSEYSLYAIRYMLDTKTGIAYYLPPKKTSWQKLTNEPVNP